MLLGTHAGVMSVMMSDVMMNDVMMLDMMNAESGVRHWIDHLAVDQLVNHRLEGADSDLAGKWLGVGDGQRAHQSVLQVLVVVDALLLGVDMDIVDEGQRVELGLTVALSLSFLASCHGGAAGEAVPMPDTVVVLGYRWG